MPTSDGAVENELSRASSQSPRSAAGTASPRLKSSTSMPEATRAMLMPLKGLLAIPKLVIPPPVVIVVVDMPVPLADVETMLIVPGSIWIVPPASL